MPHPCRQAHMDKGQNQSDLIIVFIRKRACLIWYTGMRKLWIDQDFLIEHWCMIYILSVVFAEIYVWMKLKLNIRYKISINGLVSIDILLF